jgi:hypothetical protein
MTTDEQMKINQHNFVNDEIWDLIVNLYPARDDINFDVNIVNQIRIVLTKYYVEELKICTEDDFYPDISHLK